MGQEGNAAGRISAKGKDNRVPYVPLGYSSGINGIHPHAGSDKLPSSPEKGEHDNRTTVIIGIFAQGCGSFSQDNISVSYTHLTLPTKA